MSTTPITWEQWYRRAAATAVHTMRAHTERASVSAVLGTEQWALTPAGTAALQRAGRAAKATGTCPWCGRAVRPGDAITILGGRPVHSAPCLAEYDAATAGASDDGSAR